MTPPPGEDVLDPIDPVDPVDPVEPVDTFIDRISVSSEVIVFLVDASCPLSELI